MLRKSLQSESGFSLIEILIAVVILATGSVSVMAALGTSILGAGVHRSYSTAETVTRDFTEAISLKANSANPYKVCPNVTDLTPAFTGPVNSAGQPLFFATIEAPTTGTKWYTTDPNVQDKSTAAVQYWFPDPANPPNGTWITGQSACITKIQNERCTQSPLPASCDPGLQRVWVRVRSNQAVNGNSASDSRNVNQYSRVLIRRYDAQT